MEKRFGSNNEVIATNEAYFLAKDKTIIRKEPAVGPLD